jgi:sterol desaturase/sphingolipid hydroxylase (fatty acid hydroxylase superfamily)
MSAYEYLRSVVVILSVMAAMALVEVAVPLFARPATLLGRRKANLAMTVQVLLFAFVLTSAVTMAAAYVPLPFANIMDVAGLPAVAQLVLGIVVLDFAYGYVAHRTMHAWPSLWRYHRVHHSDPFVDVTTSYRTHPVEVAWRHLWLFATVWVLGVPLAALVTFRVLSALNGILEHANIRMRPSLDAFLSGIWVTPNMHKVHHSRVQVEADSNYGNLFAIHDRMFGTFLPTRRALSVEYGLDDVDPVAIQSVGGLLAMPWRQWSPQPRELVVRAG